jgi:hypothetical protein
MKTTNQEEIERLEQKIKVQDLEDRVEHLESLVAHLVRQKELELLENLPNDSAPTGDAAVKEKEISQRNLQLTATLVKAHGYEKVMVRG